MRGTPGHVHVDVFAGPKQKFVRGFTLLPDESGGWTVYDDIGLLGCPQAISELLPLAEALRVALAKLYAIVEKPVRPASGGRALQSLGYPRPTFRDVLRAIFLRVLIPGEVGRDGFPLLRAGAVDLQIDDGAFSAEIGVRGNAIAASVLARFIGSAPSRIRVERDPVQRRGEWQSSDQRLERLLTSGDVCNFVTALAREFPTVQLIVTADSRIIETIYEPEAKEWIFEVKVETRDELQRLIGNLR